MRVNKMFKAMLLMIFCINLLYAKHLNVRIISDAFSSDLNEQIMYETNKLFVDEEKIKFTIIKTAKKEDFAKIFKASNKDINIDAILILGQNNTKLLLEEKYFNKQIILLSSMALNENSLISKKNLYIVDYSTYKKDLSFIKNNFVSKKVFILNDLEKSIKKEELGKLKNYDFVYIQNESFNKKKSLEFLFSYLNENKIKSFYSFDNSSFINKTLFYNQKINLSKISRTVALELYQAFKEEKEELIKYNKVYSNLAVVLNEDIALKIEYKPSFDLLEKVLSVGSNKSKNLKINLQVAISMVLEKSYDYQISKNNLLRQNENINNAYSFYKPNINLSASYTRIDKDRAKYSNGAYVEKTSSLSLSYSQLLYSPLSYKNININKILYEASKSETKTMQDAILYQVVLNYLNTLSLEKSYEIVKNKKTFIKENLTLAENRLEVGFSDKSDIYRWQNELANVNIELVNVKASYNKQKIDLSNLLQIPNKEHISLLSYDINDEIFKLFNKTPALLISTPKDLEKLATYLSSSFIKKHNKINIYLEQIKAKKEQIKALKQSYYLPELSFNASASKILRKDGEGSRVDTLWDDKQYQSTLQVKIPLYSGGRRSIDVEKYKIDLMNLYHLLNKEKLQISKNILKDIQNISSSYSSIKYSNLAYNSSKKNYDLIQDKYAKGKTSILSLLDAQNSMIIAKMLKNSSTYSYLLDVSTIFYTIGHINILYNKSDKQNMQIELRKGL